MKAVYGIPWPNLARRINELGGLRMVCGRDDTLYVRMFHALNYHRNPTKQTIDYLLEKTGLTYEEAFAEEEV